MGNEPIRILGIGDRGILGSFSDHLRQSTNGRIIMPGADYADDAALAFTRLETGIYRGALLIGLDLRNGARENYRKVEPLASQFGRFDSPMYSYSNGLAIVRYALQKGMVLVDTLMDSEEALAEAARLGARIFKHQIEGVELFDHLIGGE